MPFSNPYSTPITVSPTEINHLDNIESNIQQQIDNKSHRFNIKKVIIHGNTTQSSTISSWDEIIFSEEEGFDFHRQEDGKYILKNTTNSTSVWRNLNINEDGGTNSSSVTSINPTGVESLTFSAGNNIDLSFDTTDGKKLKIEMGNNISDISSLTVDGEDGIKVKNGNSSHGFVEFYENSDNGENKIKVQGNELTEDVTLTLPNTTGNLISSGDIETISSDMLSTSGVTAGDYGSSTEIPVISVDSKGRISSATTSSISTDLNISSDTGSDTVSLGSDTLQFAGGTGITTSITGDTVTHAIDDTVVTLNDTQTLANKTINNSDITLSSGNTINVENGNLTLADQQINGSKILENSLNINRLNQISSMKILGNTNEVTSNIS